MEKRHSPAVSDSSCRVHVLLTIAGAIGILAMFLPFTWGTSPAGGTFDKELWRLAWPFFLPPLITIAAARWLLSGRVSPPERAIAYTVSAATVCVTLSNYVRVLEWPRHFKEQVGFLFPFIVLAFGLFALLRIRRNELLKPFGAVVSLQVAYLANCLLCLSSFFGSWQIGAYCSLVTAIVYLIQMSLVLLRDGTGNSVPVHELGN